MGWLTQSFIAVAFLTPAWLAIPFFQRNFGVSAGAFLVWYFVGTSLSVALFGVPRQALVPSVPLVVAITVVGCVFGGIANGSLFSAVAGAPNPGLAVAISNGAALTTFVAAVVFSRLWPTHFAAAEFSIQSLIGAVLIVAGAALIAIKS